MIATSPHQALYRRWRAQTFSEIVGQEAVVETLRNAVRTDRVSHALLFTGPRGTGKTSLARIVAKALNCTDRRTDGDPCDVCPACVSIREGAALDVIEIDAASNRGINEVRELRERLAYAPAQLKRKVYILDEAHQITRDAWNALLKSLEEPPEFVTFMFASTHPQEFPPAILSRLQRFDVRRLTVPEIVGKLTRILEADAREADAEAVELIAALAAGGMRDAESILDQLLSSTVDRIEASAVRELLGLADVESVEGFVAALASGDAASGIGLLDRLDERGRDIRVFLDQVVDALRTRLLAGLGRAPRPDDAAVAVAARRLAALDPTRVGPGGLRLQLELILLQPTTMVALPVEAARPAAASDRPAPVAAPVAARPRPDPPMAAPAAEPAAVPERAASQDRARAPEPARAHDAAREQPSIAPTAIGDSTGDPAADGDLERLRQGWSQVVAEISRNPATKPLITACRPIAVEGPHVTLGFPEEQAFLRDALERRRPNLEEGIGRFLGHPVNVRCVATNLDLLPPLPGDQEAADVLAEARRIFAEDLADVGEVG